MLRFPKWLVLVLVVAGLFAGAFAEDARLTKIFAQRGVNGTIVIRSLDGSTRFVHNEARARQAFLPASTFKIPNSLLALEERAIANQVEVIKWDGIKRQFAEWNKDHNLETAFQVSCVWFYQVLAGRIGKEKYERDLAAMRYGNARTGPDVRTFWLDGDLRISAEGQIDFLARFCQDQLPIQKRFIDIVKRVMIVDQTPAYTIRAKTGWTMRVSEQTGWYVGYVESAGKTWLFAMNLDITKAGDERYRREITLESLRAVGIIQ